MKSTYSVLTSQLMSQRTEASNTYESIMRATYCALCEHRYADLTMQDIAADTPSPTINWQRNDCTRIFSLSVGM